MSRELFTAIEKHDEKAVAVLLAGGTDPNYLHEKLNYYPLHAAIFELDFGGSIDIVDQLIRAGADVNRIDARTDGASPLVAALLDSQTEAARRLLVAGADPNLPCRLGDSPLRVSAEQDDVDSADMLLRYGAHKTINEAGGISGRSALGIAASNLNVGMIELLLKAGADPNALDVDDLTPRQHLPPRSEENGRDWDRIVALLEARPKRPF